MTEDGSVIDRKDYSGVYYDAALLVAPTSEYLHCAICMDLMKDPLQCPHCGHSFCAGCITEVLVLNTECPTCCCELNQSQLVTNRALLGTIGDLSIRCPTTLDSTSLSNTTELYDTGTHLCPWVGPIRDVSQHIKECEFAGSVTMTATISDETDPKSSDSDGGVSIVQQQQTEQANLGYQEMTLDVDVGSDYQHVSPDDATLHESQSTYLTVDVVDRHSDQQSLVVTAIDTSVEASRDSTDDQLSSRRGKDAVALSPDIKMQLHVYIDILLESCPYNILMVATRQLQRIVDQIMDTHVIVSQEDGGDSDANNIIVVDKKVNENKIEENKHDAMNSYATSSWRNDTILSHIPSIMEMFDSLLNVIAHHIKEASNVKKFKVEECLNTWKSFINIVVSTNVNNLPDLLQLLIEMCANLSDIADTMSPIKKAKKTVAESAVLLPKVEANHEVNGQTINDDGKKNEENVTTDDLTLKNIITERVSSMSLPLPPPSAPSSQLSVTQSLSLSPPNASGGSVLDQPQVRVPSFIPYSQIPGQTSDEVSSQGLPLDMTVVSTGNSSPYSPETKCLATEERSDMTLTSPTVTQDLLKNSEMIEELKSDENYSLLSDDNSCCYDEQSSIATDNMKKSYSPPLAEMTIKQLSERIDLSIEDTVFLILAANEDMIAAHGLALAKQHLELNSVNHMDEKSAEYVVQLSSRNVDALLQELQNNLESLTSICSSGGLDADVCFLSDCIRSNGIYVVDWRGDSYVLKSNRREVCVMLGIDCVNPDEISSTLNSNHQNSEAQYKQNSQVSGYDAMPSTFSSQAEGNRKQAQAKSGSVVKAEYDDLHDMSVEPMPRLSTPGDISVLDINSIIMTIQELSIIMELSVEDTVFLLLEANDELMQELGLVNLRNELAQNSMNDREAKCGDCLVELSSDALEVLSTEVQNNLESLTSICSSGGLDADVCFLSDCIRSNGIYVVDWRGDSYVLKSNRREVCVMLGIDVTDDDVVVVTTAQQRPQPEPEALTASTPGVVCSSVSAGTMSEVMSSFNDQVNRMRRNSPPEGNTYLDTAPSISLPPLSQQNLEHMSFSSYDINTDFDSSDCLNESQFLSSDFPPNSPALTSTASTEMQEMIQCGFSSTWDSSISDYITLQDLACQWKISIISLIYLGERQVVPILSPSHEEFTSDQCGAVTQDWLVRNECVSEILQATQEKLFNVLQLSDMFDNISDICQTLSKSQISIVHWDDERYILQSDMEAAMEVCINYEA